MPMVAGSGGSGRLRSGGEESLGLEARFQLLEAQVQLADARLFDGVHVELVVAALLVEAHAAMREDGHAVAHRRDAARRAAEEHAAQGGELVFQREVAVARGGLRVVGDFATDPDILEVVVLFQEVFDVAGDLTDGDDAHGRLTPNV